MMADDQYFQSLSDYEEVTYFNQPYLLQDQEQQQQLFPFIISPAEASGALELQEAQGQASELGQFQFGSGGGEPFEPLPFDFNTVPHPSFQQPSLALGEQWMAAHDGGVFESPLTPEEAATKGEASPGQEASPAPFAQPPATESAVAAVQQQQDGHLHLAHGDDHAHHVPAQAALPAVPPPRRILPSNGLHARPVHRQPQSRARRLPVLQSPQAAAERAAKDRFLVQSRLQGVSYKEIKQRGNFTEAESTLRGRFRTLTKKKEDRVRDPKWTDVDIQLLKEAVQVLGHGQHPDAAKISWMAVSSYIIDHGGTYRFGYSTCHRRWVHLESTGQLGENWCEDSWEDYDEDEDEDEDDENEGGEGGEGGEDEGDASPANGGEQVGVEGEDDDAEGMEGVDDEDDDEESECDGGENIAPKVEG
ncbi:hypothetical protein Trco_006045 [Trichoderma cornu-damae]|uniref:Myb-like domain-containing protein n=1 Tax=Trichoderma cornu-damae TaxID=654480 RepID=A0A9P8TWC7_9HYPO|nr:hypothetical protein Trco_006045 [Trichoderma cornu-damae]